MKFGAGVEDALNMLYTEKKIYKGKLQEGIEREINNKTTIKVNLDKIANTIEITQGKTTTETEGKKEEINTEYKKTTINKQNITNILGENGEIQIKNAKTKAHCRNNHGSK